MSNNVVGLVNGVLTQSLDATSIPTASAIANWDANVNLSASNFIQSYVSTVSSVSTITLTVASAYQQYVTGSTNQVVQMPVASTIVEGQCYEIVNSSSAPTTVKSSGNNNILVMAANTVAIFTCVLNSGTTAASWTYTYGPLAAGITGTGSLVLATSPTIAGGTYTDVVDLGIRDTSAAFDVTIAATSSTALTAGKTLTIDMKNASNTIVIPPLSSFSSLADGTAGQLLSTLGGGSGYSWATALTTALNQYNIPVGNSSNVYTATDTSLLGNIEASTISQSYTVTNASPAVFTVAAAPATGATAYVTVTQNGFTANTTYYVIKVSGTTFKLATTLANAVAGTGINSSGSTAGTIVNGGLTVANKDAPSPGTISGSYVTAGYVGETMFTSFTSASASGVTAGQYGNLVTLSLTPGNWIVYSGFYNTRVSSQNEITGAISIYSNNTTTDHVSGTNVLTATAATTGAGNTLITLPPWRQSVTTTTTQYLKAKLDAGTWGQSNFVGYMYAERIS